MTFLITHSERKYTQQYSHIYFYRLAQLRSRLIERCKKKWNDVAAGKLDLVKISQIQADTPCVIIGTIYMDLKDKPNILREVESEDYELRKGSMRDGMYPSSELSEPNMSFNPSTDKMYLEDESGRIELDHSIHNKIVTGMVVALKGHEPLDTGIFKIQDMCLSGISFPPSNKQFDIRELDKISSSINENNNYIAFVSGLNLQNSDVIALDILFGHILSNPSINRIIVAGNIFKHSFPEKDRSQAKKFSTILIHYVSLLSSKSFNTKTISFMPGSKDPTTLAIPQQPLLKSLLFGIDGKKSMQELEKNNIKFELVTNPFKFEDNGISYLGTSGQNIDNIKNYPIAESWTGLEASWLTLNCQHIAPTAPDTLWCYPFHDQDPFIIDTFPNVYFIGNQDQFSTKYEIDDNRVVRCITIPKFSECPSVVLVDSNSLSCSWIPINTK